MRPRKERLDRIAREAARLIGIGRTANIDEALRTAAEALGEGAGPLPGRGRVRRHAQAMSMQALGHAGYAALQREHLRIAEELMTALEHVLPRAGAGETLLVGRAALGQIDAGVTLHIRIYTEEPIGALAQALVDLGYDEPVFKTVHTRFGPLSRLVFTEEGVEIAITRCLPAMAESSHHDLFREKPIASLTLEALRAKLEAKEPDDHG